MAFQAAQWIPFLRPRPAAKELPALRGIAHGDAVSALEDAGFWILREGVHVVMTDGKRILTIPCNDPVHAFTMEGIVRDAGLTIEKFRQLL
jgi:predicted RNA binding protein YcfA (HicA-like mRNA interferase family)